MLCFKNWKKFKPTIKAKFIWIKSTMLTLQYRCEVFTKTWIEVHIRRRQATSDSSLTFRQIWTYKAKGNIACQRNSKFKTIIKNHEKQTNHICTSQSYWSSPTRTVPLYCWELLCMTHCLFLQLFCATMTLFLIMF